MTCRLENTSIGCYSTPCRYGPATIIPIIALREESGGRERNMRREIQKKLTDKRECGKCRFTKLEYPLAKLSVHGFGGHNSGQRGGGQVGYWLRKNVKKKNPKKMVSLNNEFELKM